MPKKPVKFGFKVWVCAEADTGYALQVEMYEGRARTLPRIAQKSKYGTGYDVVNELTKLYQQKNHIIYIDRFFSSVALAEHLLRQHTYVNSTVMLNRKGTTTEIKKLKLKKTDPCHQYRRGQSNLLVTVFYDKRQVSHLSTGCLPGLTDGGIKPLVNEDYNKYMGGVDLCDQHGSYYRVGRKTVKWWKYIAWHFISLAINNAYVVYKASRPPIATGGAVRSKLRTHKEFRLDIIEQLVGTFARTAPVKRLRLAPGVVLMNPADAIAHVCEKTVNLKICQHCSAKSGKRTRTVNWCKDCKVNLCPIGCFQRYHAEHCGISPN